MKKTWVLLTCALASTARADVRVASGHADIGLGYAAGGLELRVHQLLPIEARRAPGEVTFVVGDAAKAESYGGVFTPAFGIAGTPVWNLPATQNPDLPFVGFGTSDLRPSDWGGNIQLTLTGFSGPGNMVIWNPGWFGSPNVPIDSTRGTGPLNTLLLLPGNHTHYNIGFSQPGTYAVTFEAMGTYTPTKLIAMGAGTYRFEVVPEPSTYALMAVGGGVLLWSVRRRA